MNKIVATRYWKETPSRLKAGLDPDIVQLEQEFKRSVQADEPFVYIDLFDFLCNDEGCRTYIDGDRRDGLMTFDVGHLTSNASSYLARSLLAPKIMELLSRPGLPDARSLDMRADASVSH